MRTVEEQLRLLHQALTQLALELPQVAFSPPLDVFERDGDLVIELAIPGVGASDVQVVVTGNVVAVSGARPDGARPSLHAEIPRGPFRRVLVLPRGVTGEARVQLDSGIVRIHLTQSPPPSVAQA